MNEFAWLISDILSDEDARRLGFGPNTVLRIDRPAAVKTGTTSNFHDNWTVGYTPDLVVGVWTGNTTYEPIRDVDGLSGAAPIWHEFIRTVSSGLPRKGFEQPPGMERIEICAISGMLPSEVCPYRKWEWFIAGTQPEQEDTIYRQVILDMASGGLAQETTPVERRARSLALNLPAQARNWASLQGLSLYQDLLENNVSLLPDSAMDKAVILQIVSPANGSQFHVAPNMDLASQRIPMRVAGPENLREVSFWVDNQVIGTVTQAPFQLWWTLEAGESQIWAEAIAADGSKLTSESIHIFVHEPNTP